MFLCVSYNNTLHNSMISLIIKITYGDLKMLFAIDLKFIIRMIVYSLKNNYIVTVK